MGEHQGVQLTALYESAMVPVSAESCSIRNRKNIADMGEPAMQQNPVVSPDSGQTYGNLEAPVPTLMEWYNRHLLLLY